jgi:hypothetical protein
MYDALMPATRSTAWAVVIAAATQSVKPRSIIVMDTAVKPLTSQYEFRMAADIAVEKQVEFIYLRGRGTGVRNARIALGDKSNSEWMFWMDDDSIPEPTAVEECLSMKQDLVVCRVPTPNNEYGGDEWSSPTDGPQLWSYGRKIDSVNDVRAGLGATLVRSVHWPKMREVFSNGHTGGGSDREAWFALGSPVVCPNAVSWEMKHPEARAFIPFVRTDKEPV